MQHGFIRGVSRKDRHNLHSPGQFPGDYTLAIPRLGGEFFQRHAFSLSIRGEQEDLPGGVAEEDIHDFITGCQFDGAYTGGIQAHRADFSFGETDGHAQLGENHHLGFTGCMRGG
jgi:hypothetical protein